MIVALATTDAARLAARVRARGAEPGWTLVVVSDDVDPMACATAVREELDALAHEAHVDASDDIEDALRRAGPNVALLAPAHLDGAKLERSRSRLVHQAPVVLFLRKAAVEGIDPHTASWLAGAMLAWAPDDGVEARAQRIAALEARYGITSAQLAERAEAGTVAYDDPYLAEWLVLIGRGAWVGRDRS